MISLPIESSIVEIKEKLFASQQVILQAPPGAGKSTFLPFTMLKDNWFSGKIIMLEPRRLAVKNIAYYIASLLGEEVGQRVGYRMRGESKVSNETKLEIVTEGILTRILQNDPELIGVDLLIFDEFHERNLQGDLGLAFALDAQSVFCESLKILIMSATLDNQCLQKQLPDADFCSVEGRSFPISYFYHPIKTDKRQYKQYFITDLVKLVILAYQQQAGNILVFLPGIKEIKQTQQILTKSLTEKDVAIMPLYGSLTLKEQQQVLIERVDGKRKICLATNIAETSLTIEGITVVVDSGFERSMLFQAQSGIGKLQLQQISEASATQRAGRAGRLGAGFCYRLWSKEIKLNKQIQPEILRSDLTGLLLEVLHWGVSSMKALPFTSLPSEKNSDAALALLLQFKAITAQHQITKQGKAIIKLGVSPRLGHLLLRAQEIAKNESISGLVNLACLLVATLESNEKTADDIETLLDSPSFAVKTQYKKLLQKFNIRHTNLALPMQYCGMLLALAFPDRIAFSRQQTGQYQLSNGVGASLFESSALIGESVLVVADLAFSDKQVNSIIYKACRVSLDQLKEYAPHYFNEIDYVCWQMSNKKLIAEKRVMLGKLLISKQPINNLTKQQKETAVIEGIKQAGLSVLSWSPDDKQLLARLRYANFCQNKEVAKGVLKIGFPDFNNDTLISELTEWFAPFLNGAIKPEQLKKINLKEALLARLSWDEQQRFNVQFPTHIKVPTGSNIKIVYRENDIPVLSVRMQELFGQAVTPCIYDGKIKLQLALLSPARRPLQLTQDLATFWAGAYQDVKKEMKGRYPKHYWPDNPLEAVATRKVKKHLSL